MELDNFIQTAMRRVLKNPILTVLKDINFSSILKQSNFIKRDIGVSPYLITLQFLYMFIINKKISTFMKYSNDSFKKDVYYRLLKNEKYNWRKLLLLSSAKLIKRLHILQKNTDTKVLIIDDTVEIKRGQSIEGCCKNLWSNKEKRVVKGVNIVSLNYSDSYTDMMLDFSINYNKNKITDVMNNYFHHNSNANKRRVEGYNGKNILALDMLQRVLKLGIYADYLLVDSWYAKPDFINTVQTNGLNVIARIANNPRIWQFVGKHNTLESLYTQAKKQKTSKFGNYNTIKYTYISTITTHKTLGRIKIVFIKTKDNLIPIISTNTNLSDIEIINTYKKRWNIEQGYKDLREYFQFGKEENRIYEALIARITLSFLAYNITSYINRINNEPQTLGNLFRDLECQLETLAISMELFLKILEQLIQSAQIVKRNKDLEQIIEILRVHTKKQLGFMCESWVNKSLLKLLGYDNLSSFNEQISDCKELFEFNDLKVEDNYIDYIVNHPNDKFLVALKNANSEIYYDRKFYISYKHFENMNKSIFLFIEEISSKAEEINEILEDLIKNTKDNVLVDKINKIYQLTK